MFQLNNAVCYKLLPVGTSRSIDLHSDVLLPHQWLDCLLHLHRDRFEIFSFMILSMPVLFLLTQTLHISSWARPGWVGRVPSLTPLQRRFSCHPSLPPRPPSLVSVAPLHPTICLSLSPTSRMFASYFSTRVSSCFFLPPPPLLLLQPLSVAMHCFCVYFICFESNLMQPPLHRLRATHVCLFLVLFENETSPFVDASGTPTFLIAPHCSSLPPIAPHLPHCPHGP